MRKSKRHFASSYSYKIKLFPNPKPQLLELTITPQFSAMDETRGHVLFVLFPAQGHINPGLQFAKALARRRVHVTFAAPLQAYRRIAQTPTLKYLSFASFSDGYDNGFKGADVHHFLSELERRGSQAVKDLILSSAHHGRPVTSVVYSLLLPWAAEVARSLHVPSAFLWIQPAVVLAAYYYYFNGYKDAIRSVSDDAAGTVELPGLPLLTGRDLPSFLHSSNVYDFLLPIVQRHLEMLEQETNPKVLVNTFEDLEHDALSAIRNFELIPIGPLIPSAFLDGNDPSDASYGGDMFHSSTDSEDYVDWLNSKPKSSVVFVSSGTVAKLSKQQTEEIAGGLIDSGRPFLWVIRETVNDNGEDELSCRGELEIQGKIVSWCSQLRVLSNPAIGCFLTHCGWNSTLESLSCGLPVVALPQWTDQPTNAKIIGELAKTGVRLKANEDGVVGREEIRSCLELLMGDSEEAEEIRRNAMKLKKLAKKAAMDGGSSYLNLNAFVDGVCKSV